jgi:hypothetical protein
VIETISRMSHQNQRITSLDAEEALHKIQHPLIIKEHLKKEV